MTDVTKRAYVKDKFTQNEFEELKKCIQDPLYFMENYVYIQNTKTGKQLLELYDFQKRLVDTYHNYRNVVALLSRQLGKTTTAAAYLLWTAMFKPDQTILVVANQESQALEIIQRVKYAYEELPDWLRAGVIEYNKKTIIFDNKSRIISRATHANSGRGLTINLLYADEFAFVERNLQEEFWSAILPTLSSGGRMIMTSTPSSDDDLFAHIFRKANDTFDRDTQTHNDVGSNGFKAIKVTYHEHPDRNPDTPEGAKWEAEYMAALGEEKFRREMTCEFINANDTLIDSIYLTSLKAHKPILKEGLLKWYNPIEANKVYCFALDPSTGVGKDYAAIQVFSLPDMEQVCEWADRKANVRQQLEVMRRLQWRFYKEMRNMYNQIGEPELFWSFENNAIGEATLQVLQDTGEEHFPATLCNEPRRSGLHLRYRRGFQTTQKTKIAACLKLKSLIERGTMKVHSEELIKELNNFIASGMSFKGADGTHDDLVDALLILCRILIHIQTHIPEVAENIHEGLDADDYVDPMPVSVLNSGGLFF